MMVPGLSIAGGPSVATEDVVRGELLSDDRLAEFARSIASTDTHVPGTPFRFQVKNELTIAWSAIQSACVVIECAVREERSITQAARWLIENVHVVEEQLAEIQQRPDLVRSFFNAPSVAYISDC